MSPFELLIHDWLNILDSVFLNFYNELRSLTDGYTELSKLSCCDYDLFDNYEYRGFHTAAFSYANTENFQCPHLFDNCAIKYRIICSTILLSIDRQNLTLLETLTIKTCGL